MNTSTMKKVMLVIPKTAIEIIVDLWPILLLCMITTICLKIAYSLANRTKLEIYKEIINLVFIAYVIMLFSLVTATDFSSFGNNFVPFNEIFRYSVTSKLFYRNVIGNVVLFIPFGYYTSYYCKTKNITYSFLITLIVSSTVETIQLLLGRSFDVDDIILNVVGGVVGYLFYLVSEFIFKKTSERVKNSFLLNLICVLIIAILVIIILNLYGVVI